MMNAFFSVWKPLGLSIIFALLVKFLISYVVLSSFHKAIVDAEFDHPDIVDLYYSSGTGFQKKLFVTSGEFPANTRKKIRIALKDNVVRNLRIDLGRQGGAVKLYGLTLTSFYGHRVEFDHKQLYGQFEPNQDIETFTLQEDCLLVTSQANDPFLIYTGSLKLENYFLANVLPVILGFVFFLLITNISYSAFPAFTDMNTKTSSIGVNIGSLDGIRGLAALMVLAEHTGVLRGIGALGVWLFFALSGFLLATPFIQNPQRAVSYNYMSQFLVRRMRRILPIYYSFLAVAMVFQLKNPDLFRHFLFLQGDGHLWTLPQEMFFYLILPFIVIASFLVFRGNKLWIVVFLIILMVGANRYLTTSVVPLYGYGRALKPLVGIFIAGVMFSYFHSWLCGNRLFQKIDRSLVCHSCSAAGIILIIALVFISHREIPLMRYLDPSRAPGICGFLAGLFILLVVLANGTLLSRIMGFLPLRAIGLVSFSFYLFHPHMIFLSRSLIQYYFNFRLVGFAMFVTAGTITYLIAALTYTYIERPFLHKAAVRK